MTNEQPLEELHRATVTEMARELVLEKYPDYDPALFDLVMGKILEDGGSKNAFDAPILYQLVSMMGFRK